MKAQKILMKLSFVIISSMIFFIGCAPSPDIPEFPWPPPQATATVDITDQMVDTAFHLLGDVDRKLTRALNTLDYQKSYYSVPNGFAVVTKIEQINNDGTPKDPGRWSVDVQRLSRFSFREYLRALFTANPGHFRVIVFIVSSQPFSQSDSVVGRDVAIDWLRDGINSLPSSISNMEFTPEYKITALIYEFIKPEFDEPYLSLSSHLSGRDHLNKSGLLQTLN